MTNQPVHAHIFSLTQHASSGRDQSGFERKSLHATKSHTAIAASQMARSRTTGPRDDENIGGLFGEYMNQPPLDVSSITRRRAFVPANSAAATAMLTLTPCALFIP